MNKIRSKIGLLVVLSLLVYTTVLRYLVFTTVLRQSQHFDFDHFDVVTVKENVTETTVDGGEDANTDEGADIISKEEVGLGDDDDSRSDDDDDKDNEDAISDSDSDNRNDSAQYSHSHSLSPHPIDKYIEKETTEGSSLRTILTELKHHSLPEGYGDEISTEEDIEIETQRCARYGYEYNPSTIKKRRRIFMGSLIADDSWHVIATHAAEAYGLYHTVSLIESNTTQTMTKRETRFDKWSLNWNMLQSGIFGPKTDVYVDFRVDVAADYPDVDPLQRENLQRSHIIQRWKAAGMKKDDVGIICDVDEVFTRDFLLALQSCDIPKFRPGQDCHLPHIQGSGLTFELVPDCGNMVKRYFHRPQAVIGECIDGIGDATVHKPGLRRFANYRGGELIGERSFAKDPQVTMYPLWEPWDFRLAPDGPAVFVDGGLHTAYHFHNFFDSFAVLRNKYKTYGHPRENADFEPISSFGKTNRRVIQCLKGERGRWQSVDNLEGRRPILFENEAYRIARWKEMEKEMVEDEKRVAEHVAKLAGNEDEDEDADENF